jgi:hypothetical protein
MYAFYQRLVRALQGHDPALEPLARLTRLDPARLRALPNAMSWGDWPTATA